ncbi:PKD domain-containing protein [Paraflavitalea pollutisoli]|uniref:PKD domain-containing protein n=1 Tax=Paraflavitalea pollutisoli TaxID=3034143 RepID=UPI0023EB59F2|nr:T9SS type A sorting domain-containing protein [Paraflavitalea sp. H1-2-19X]
MKNLLLFLGLFITLTVSAQQVPKSLRAANGDNLGFYQYTPKNYNTSTKYPLIISLHGVGERGNGTTELKNVLGIGIPAAINAGYDMTFTWNGKTESFVVLSPQLTFNYGGWGNWHIDEMINYAKKNLSIDEDRIFLTGMSLGGGAVWQYIGGSLANSQKLAGVVLCCAVGPWYIDFSNITKANLPIWAFHAQNDYTVGPNATTNGIANINKLNPAVVPYMTIYPTGGHIIWGEVYDVTHNKQDPNIYEWFLAQNKKLPVNKRPTAVAGDDIITSPTAATVTLNSSRSSDPDGKLVRYVWRKISGPAAGTIQTPVSTTGGTTLVTGLTVAGTYLYELKVADERCDWDMDTVKVTVSAGPPPAGNKPPVVDAGDDIVVQQPVTQVALRGSATDPDGRIISYTWIQTKGPQGARIENPNNATTQVVGLLVGDYSFRLIAVDDKNVTAGDDINVKVLTADGRGSTGVNPGPNVTITLPTNSLTLDGTASYDPYGGSIYGWRWIKLSGPAAGTVTNTGVSVTTATGLVAGNYVFQLTTWNSLWVPQSATKIVTVLKATGNPNNPDNGNGGNPGNPPANTQIAKAGPDQTIQLPTNSVTLNGSASVDPAGALTGIGWTKLSGPASGTITNSKALTTTVTGLTEGSYQFRLTVLNSQSVPSSDTMVVTVKAAPKPSAPRDVAKAGADQTIQLPTNSVTLNGSQSIDPTGPLTGISWTKVSGPAGGNITSSGALTTTVTGLSAGTYEFRLTVMNSESVPSSDEVIITVKPAVQGPVTPRDVAKAGPDQTIQLPTSSVTLNGSQSIDPTGKLLGIDWKKISGPSSGTITDPKALTTTVTGLTEGVHAYRLLVYNSQWVPSMDTVVITVKAGTEPKPPTSPRDIAKAGPDQTIQLPNSSVTLNGTQSIDPNGALLGVDWKQISGPATSTITNAKALTTTITGLKEGVYAFRLLVYNTQWVPSMDTVQITVKAATTTTPPPVNDYRRIAKAGPDQTIKLPTNTVSLDGSATTDPRGPLRGIGWTKLSGPAAGTITTSNALKTTVTGLAAGIYQFRLLVYNTEWVPSYDTIQVTVQAAGNTLLTDTRSVNSSITEDLITPVDDKLVIFPNPAQSQVNVQASSNVQGAANLNVYDMSGKLVLKVAFQKAQSLHQQVLNITSLKPGLYQVEVLIGRKTRLKTKFVKL